MGGDAEQADVRRDGQHSMEMAHLSWWQDERCIEVLRPHDGRVDFALDGGV